MDHVQIICLETLTVAMIIMIIVMTVTGACYQGADHDQQILLVQDQRILDEQDQWVATTQTGCLFPSL